MLTPFPCTSKNAHLLSKKRSQIYSSWHYEFTMLLTGVAGSTEPFCQFNCPVFTLKLLARPTTAQAQGPQRTGLEDKVSHL